MSRVEAEKERGAMRKLGGFFLTASRVTGDLIEVMPELCRDAAGRRICPTSEECLPAGNSGATRNGSRASSKHQSHSRAEEPSQGFRGPDIR